MTENNSNTRETEAVLKWFLPDVLARGANSSAVEEIETEDLVDLVEGRLDATEREDLIERIESTEDLREALADLLIGIEESENLASRSEETGSALVSSLVALKDWAESCMTAAVPAVSAYSAATLDRPIALDPEQMREILGSDSLEEAFNEKATEVLDLIGAGEKGAEVLTVLAEILEVYLTFSQEHGASTEAFARIWGPVLRELGIEIERAADEEPDRFEGYRSIREVYKKALELDPDSGEVYVGLARVDLQLGETASARKNLEEGIARNPGDSAALQLLARLRSDRDG